MPFFVFFGHPIKRIICYSTPPTCGHTIEASFPDIFIFSCLSNRHIQQCFDKRTNERTHKLTENVTASAAHVPLGEDIMYFIIINAPTYELLV